MRERYDELSAKINGVLFDLRERPKATAWMLRDRAEAKPGGTRRLSNLVNQLFESIPDAETGRPYTSEDLAEWSRQGGEQAPSLGLPLETIEAMREGTPVSFSEADLLQFCDFFDIDFCYFEDSQAPSEELDPPVAEARRWRAEHPDWPQQRFFLEDLCSWMAEEGLTAEEAAREIGGIHPQRLRAVLDGRTRAPLGFELAAGEAMGLSDEVARERWSGRWIGNDLIP